MERWFGMVWYGTGVNGVVSSDSGVVEFKGNK